MRERKIPCVQGNHDAKAQYMWFTYREPLTDRSLLYLSQLPTSLLYHWLGVAVYITHSNPWEDSSIYIHPDRPMVLFREVVNAVEARIIILGHSHHPMRVEVDDKIILNPGSVSENRNRPERTCGVLSLPDCGFDLYDIDTNHKLVMGTV